MYETHKLDTQTAVYFYEQDFYILSNFSAFQVVYRGVKYNTAEHAYHFMKFVHTHYKELYITEHNLSVIRNEILYSTSAHDAFTIARKYKEFVNPSWDGFKLLIMKEILWEKVIQHEYVKKKLLATGDRELIEDSWRDDFWGWGPNGDGKNMLGKLWMEVRTELQGMVI